MVSGLKKVGVSRKRKKKTYEQREASASTVDAVYAAASGMATRRVHAETRQGGISASSCIVANVTVGSGAEWALEGKCDCIYQ